MTMTDELLEDRLRRTCRAVAEATPVDADVVLDVARRSAGRHRPRLALAAAAAVLVVAMVVAAAALRHDQPVGVTTAPFPIAPLPPGLDLVHGIGVYHDQVTGGPAAVARAYVASRFGDGADGVTLDPPAVSGFDATVRWSTTAARGELRLRQGSKEGVGLDQWWVRSASTDTVDVGSIAYTEGRVAGVVRSAADAELTVDLVDIHKEVVAHEAGRGQVALDVEVGANETQLQVKVVDGGTPVSITEFRLAQSQPTEWRELAHGSWAGGAWQLLGSGRAEHPSPSELACFQIRLHGEPGGSTGCGGGEEALPKRFVALGSATRQVGDEQLVFGQLGPDVARLVIRVPGRDEVVVEAVTDPARPRWDRYAMFAMPVAERAEVEAFGIDGRSLGSASFDPRSGMPVKLER